MTTWDDVTRIAEALPGAEPSTSWGRPCYKVQGKAFVTQRPLSKRDRAQLQERHEPIPEGELILVGVEHEIAKQAVIETEAACFTIPHLNGYPAVLVELEKATPDLLEELIGESFLIAGGDLQP